ncbi:MAG: hypothetical protein WC748_02720 [Legionellales bacterium]|jgi:hypothetical protein
MTFAATAKQFTQITEITIPSEYRTQLNLFAELCDKQSTAEQQTICKQYAKQIFNTATIHHIFTGAINSSVLEMLKSLIEISNKHPWLSQSSFLNDMVAHIQRAGNRLIKNPLTSFAYSSLMSAGFLFTYLPTRQLITHYTTLLEIMNKACESAIPSHESRKNFLVEILKALGPNVNCDNMEQRLEDAKETKAFVELAPYILIPTVLILGTYHLGAEHKSATTVSPEWLKAQQDHIKQNKNLDGFFLAKKFQ